MSEMGPASDASWSGRLRHGFSFQFVVSAPAKIMICDHARHHGLAHRHSTDGADAERWTAVG